VSSSSSSDINRAQESARLAKSKSRNNSKLCPGVPRRLQCSPHGSSVRHALWLRIAQTPSPTQVPVPLPHLSLRRHLHLQPCHHQCLLFSPQCKLLSPRPPLCGCFNIDRKRQQDPPVHSLHPTHLLLLLQQCPDHFLARYHDLLP
jgi:hypothetical protein